MAYLFCNMLKCFLNIFFYLVYFLSNSRQIYLKTFEEALMMHIAIEVKSKKELCLTRREIEGTHCMQNQQIFKID